MRGVMLLGGESFPIGACGGLQDSCEHEEHDGEMKS